MPAIRVASDFRRRYPGASPRATESAMNLVRTGDLIVTRATVTGLVDSLQRRGFVRRFSHPKDRRSLLVEITPAGRRTLNVMRPLVHRHQRVWLQALSEREQERLIELLGRIQEHLDALPRTR